MRSKQLLPVSLLLLFTTPGLSIIQPPRGDSALVNAKQIISDFKDWNWKRDQYLRFSKDYPFGWPSFDCKKPAHRSEAIDAHHLSPWDFGVIGAIGDSLTAGRAAGAEVIDEIALDFRGLSFATGGQHNLSSQATLSNILEHFSPNLKGASEGIGTSDDVLIAGFNLANSGGFTGDLPSQAKELVNRIRAHHGVDMHNQWKFINIFVGSNDLCKVCQNQTLFGAEQYAKHLQETVRYLRDILPRTYVNIVPPFHVEVLLETQPDNPFCVDLQSLSCQCISEMPRKDFLEIKSAFDQTLDAFAAAEFQTRDFATAVSYGVNVDNIATLGKSLNLAFIALDCFHFSTMAHDIVAKIIWSDLFKPIKSRTPIEWSTFQPQLWKCPPEDCPYMRTPLNSENCSQPTKQLTSIAKNRKITYDSTAYLPSVGDLERRAFMEEHGTTFFLVILGVMVVFLIACVTTMCCCKRSQRPYYPSERSRLLDPKMERRLF